MEGVRSKDLKSDLEIMLTEHSSCVCAARALHQGHRWLSEVSLTICTGWVSLLLGVNQENMLEPGGTRQR